MKTSRPPRMGPDMRAYFGCIATLIDEETDRRYAQRFADVEDVIAHCDRHEVRVLCISTPDTILRDLQGTRSDINYAPRARSGSRQPADRLQLPEEKQLASKHRLDLFAGGRA